MSDQPNYNPPQAGFDPNDQYSKKAAAINDANRVSVDGDLGGARVWHSPGAADYGGSPDAAAAYKQDALDHMGDNAGAMRANGDALSGSLANMTGNRGPQSVEDAALNSRAAGTREQQLRALALQRDAAQGSSPSAAAFQTTQGMNDIMGSRAGAVGSARGLAGLSGAQMGAGAQVGQSSGNVAVQGGMGRSKEIGDALGMYGSNAGAMRQQDIQRLGISDANSKFNASNDLNWKLGNANLAVGQAGLGVAQGATNNQWLSDSQAPAAKQFGYDQEMAAEQAGADADAAGASIAKAREANDHAKGLVQGGTSAALGAVGSLAGPVGTAGGAAAGAGINTATNDWWK